MNEVFFVDLDGKIISDDAISSHIGLAKKIVAANEELKIAFQNSDYTQEDLFLIQEIGYAEGCNELYNQFLLINREKSTKKQKDVLYGLVQEGYKYYFADEERAKVL